MDLNATDPRPAEKGGNEIGLDTCAACGESVDTDEWHPIDVDIGGEGDVQLHVFCSRACQEEWECD